ncbi:MAG TPA: hypothetical protein ENN73_04705, partial [Firmicutes bacterium]|nr:hypothetical protein [Bacillota bacterium]
MNGFLKKLFIGPGLNDDPTPDLAIRTQKEYLKIIWDDNTYGVERLLRLFLFLIQFIFPVIYLRSVFRGLGKNYVKIIVEFYNMLKFIFPLLLLFLAWYQNKILIYINIYFMFETVFNILIIIFLSDIYSRSLSFQRSIILLIMNYLQITTGFAVIYIGFDLLTPALTPLSALYASFVTTATLGYGDYLPRNSAGQTVVILQLVA